MRKINAYVKIQPSCTFCGVHRVASSVFMVIPAIEVVLILWKVFCQAGELFTGIAQMPFALCCYETHKQLEIPCDLGVRLAVDCSVKCLATQNIYSGVICAPWHLFQDSSLPKHMSALHNPAKCGEIRERALYMSVSWTLDTVGTFMTMW